MAKIKLPEALKSWKVVSRLPDADDRELYKIVGTDGDGAQKEAQLAYYEFTGSLYNQDDIEYIKDEADFVRTIKGLGDISNYVDVVIDDVPDKEQMKLFIVTDNSKPLSEVMKDRQYTDDEVIDFGLQMSEILEKIEGAGIFHGDIKPSNIFVTEDGKYKLGAFMDAESTDDDAYFAAPEMQKGDNADFTTDLYSLGMIMYSMCNSGRLPFEGDGVSSDEATDRRLSGEAVPAPQNGSQKLKSVIMIAIQPENKNRWKNAGNIKNALLSLKNEEKEPAAQVIVPASTEFDGNVFEDSPAKDEPSDELDDIKPSYQEPEIDNRVFDDYKNQTKVFSIDPPSGDKDYGDYFDDGVDLRKPAKQEKQESPEEDENGFLNPFYTGAEEDKKDKKDNKGKKGMIIAIIAGIIIILALLGALGVIAYNNGFFGSPVRGSTMDTAAPATTGATVAATTAPSSTAATQPTTVSATEAASSKQESSESSQSSQSSEKPVEYVTVKVVRGMTVEEARATLEADGLTLTEGAHRPSNDYPAGQIIAQTPGDGHSVAKGTSVLVDISTGPESKPESSQQSQSSSQQSSGGDDSFSSSRLSTGYLSQSEISEMSRDELNFTLNEIYARHGRIFKSARLDAYFRSQSWYTPKYTEEEFSKYVVFNDYERKNANALLNEQKKRGYRS